MALVLTCNECGEPIDETGPYYSATVIEMNAPPPGGGPPTTPATLRMDWHVEHIPLSEVPETKPAPGPGPA
jgi:hypothetical protein